MGQMSWWMRREKPWNKLIKQSCQKCKHFLPVVLLLHIKVCFPKVSNGLWTSDVYFMSHAFGHCYTYNPPKDGISTFEGGISIFLGHKYKDNQDLYGHQIYIHEKDQFWPNENLPSVKRFKLGLWKSAWIYYRTWSTTKLSSIKIN